MGLVADAAQAWKEILEDSDEFGVSITITTPDNSLTATVTGIHTKHHQSFNFDQGRPVNSKNAHITVSEKSLTDAGFTVRTNNEVTLLKYKVTVADSSGTTRHYKIIETMPDETVGVIVITLQDLAT